MRNTATLLTVLTGLAIALPAQASDAQSTPRDGAEAAPKKEKTICRRESFVGSNLPVKTCRTESVWKAIDAAARQSFTERDRSNNR